MDTKTVFGIISGVIGLIAFLPYIKEALSHKSQPHPFTWLIFALTQAAGAGITLESGGDKGSILLFVGAILCTVIFFLSLYKSKEIITKSDILVLSLAFISIFIWIFLNNPLLSILMISAIDAFGYIPTFRKSFFEPHKEPVSIWGTFIIANSFAILALEEYSLLTLSYLITITVANIALVIFLNLRRRQVQTLASFVD